MPCEPLAVVCNVEIDEIGGVLLQNDGSGEGVHLPDGELWVLESESDSLGFVLVLRVFVVMVVWEPGVDGDEACERDKL